MGCISAVSCSEFVGKVPSELHELVHRKTEKSDVLKIIYLVQFQVSRLEVDHLQDLVEGWMVGEFEGDSSI